MSKFLTFVTAGVAVAILAGCGLNEDVAFELSSASFEAGAPLPATYSCEGKAFGEGIAPELHWTAGPEGTQSYAIVFQDVSLLTDMPDRAFHWMLWNIPSSVTSMPEGLSSDQFPTEIPGAEQLRGNKTDIYAYFGPCPSWQTGCKAEIPAVTDSYKFIVYAFNVATLTLPAVDTTISNYVRQVNSYFESMAIGKAELSTSSNAIPSTVPDALCGLIEE
jgi:phosphatidylethanolamine-binding protein (PEBP) family uncharacterized protein